MNLDRRNNFNNGRGFLSRADVNANLLNAGVNAQALVGANDLLGVNVAANNVVNNNNLLNLNANVNTNAFGNNLLDANVNANGFGNNLLGLNLDANAFGNNLLDANATVGNDSAVNVFGNVNVDPLVYDSQFDQFDIFGLN